LSAGLVRGRRVRRDPLCQDPWHQASALAHSIAGTATHQSRRDRVCQQAGPDGVGDDGYWRALQLSGLAEGLTRSRRHPAWYEGWEDEQHVKQNPLVPLHSRMRGFDRDLIRGKHYGQRSDMGPVPYWTRVHQAGKLDTRWNPAWRLAT